ncbi:MAG: acyl carrier protein [Gemmatimonadota bacterium]|jgi:acyl carrier protein
MALNEERWKALCACIVAELDDVSEDSIKPDTLLREDLEIDSLLAANLAFELEDTFEILIEEEEMTDVRTVGDLARLIEAKVES